MQNQLHVPLNFDCLIFKCALTHLFWFLGAAYSVGFSGDKRKGLIGHKMGQFSGMLIKRFHHYRRDWRMFLSVFVLPLVFMTASLGLMELQPKTESAPARILTPPLYGPYSHAFFKWVNNTDNNYAFLSSIQNIFSIYVLQWFHKLFLVGFFSSKFFWKSCKYMYIVWVIYLNTRSLY